MLTTNSAPPAAWVMIGPFGLHASSQMEMATRTPATTNNGPSTVEGAK